MDESLRKHALVTRVAIRSGALRGDALWDRILDVPVLERDAWVDVMLGIETSPPEDRNLPRGAVPYVPCGVGELLAFVTEAPVRSGDHVVDVGSGLGRAAVLVHLLTGASVSGIEIQSSLVELSRRLATDLGISSASFLHADAADMDLEGSIFFLYAPCNGDMLRRVLVRIEAVARRRTIVVATVGMELGGVPWLVPRDTSSRTLALYDSA